MALTDSEKQEIREAVASQATDVTSLTANAYDGDLKLLGATSSAVKAVKASTIVNEARSGLATQTYVTDKITEKTADLAAKSQLNGLATTTYVDGKVNGLATETYVNGKVTGLATSASVTQVSNALTQYQNSNNTAMSGKANTSDITAINGTLTDHVALIEAAKVKLFDDIWKANGGTVNHANSAKPYRLNGLDLTYDEAVEVYRFNPQYMQEPMSALQNKQMYAVTNIAPSAMTKTTALNNFAVSTKTKVLSVNSMIPNDLRGWLGKSGTNVERILGNINLANFNRQGDLLLAGCVNLHTVEIKGIKVNLSIEKCGKLSYASMKYLVDNAANGSAAITVTVHADVYAKLTADTSNAAAAALTSDELTNWQAIATSAAAKNISFAKP